MITMITNDKYVHTTFSIDMITIDIIMYLRDVRVVLLVVKQSVLLTSALPQNQLPQPLSSHCVVVQK